MSDITNDELFEIMLRQAVIKNNKNEIAAIPSDEELEKMFTFSERHNQKMKKLFAADNRREVFTVVYKWGKVAVIAACISTTLVFGALMTSAEFRKAVGDVIVTWFEQFTKFQSEEVSEEFTERDWLPAYLPEEFYLTDTLGATGFVYTNNKNALIIFEYNPSDSSVSIDNEDMNYSVFIENDILYHLFETTITDDYHDNIVIWDMDGYRFTVTGNYEPNELIKIAFSVK